MQDEDKPAVEVYAAEKRCTGCGLVKSASEFWRHRNKRDGRMSRCKVCCREAKRKRLGQKPREPSGAPYPVSVESKHCRRCDEVKPASEFYANPKLRDGLQSWCSVCIYDASRTSRRLRPKMRCARCGKTKLASKFYSHPGGRLSSWCQECHIVSRAPRRSKRPRPPRATPRPVAERRQYDEGYTHGLLVALVHLRDVERGRRTFDEVLSDVLSALNMPE